MTDIIFGGHYFVKQYRELIDFTFFWLRDHLYIKISYHTMLANKDGLDSSMCLSERMSVHSINHIHNFKMVSPRGDIVTEHHDSKDTHTYCNNK